MFEELRDLYNDLIMDHEKRPRNYHVLEHATQSAQGFNPICGDKITLYLQIENGIIKDASFDGKSCTICKASASLLTESVKGKTNQDAEDLFVKVRELMMTGKTSEDLGKLLAFSTVHKRPIRIKCAILPWHALASALKNDSKPVSTENEET